MNAHRHSVRATLLVVGSIAVAAVSNGCASPSEKTGQNGQDLSFTPCSNCRLTFTPEITAVTTTPSSTWTSTNSPASCPDTTVPPPASLSGFNCTLGVAINGDVNLPSATFSNGVQAYAWACQTTSTTGSAVSTSLSVSSGNFGSIIFQSPLESAVTAAIQTAGTLGGPDLGGNFAAIAAPTTTDSCYGVAASGWEIVLQVPSTTYECVYHPGIETPVAHGMALSSLNAVHPFYVACPISMGGCECPPGGTPVLTQ
jgi:hypothetical protein